MTTLSSRSIPEPFTQIRNAAFTLEPFRPARGLTGAHRQTIVSNIARSRSGISFQRTYVDTPDGDQLALDFPDVEGEAWGDLEASAPIILLLHGLEGSARRGYACESYRQLLRQGLRPVGLNFRSCGGEMNNSWRMYNAGESGDVATVLAYLAERFPGVPLGLLGFSLGGNILLKLLGEGRELPSSLRAGVAISPPFDMNLGIHNLTQGIGKLYGNRFLTTLRQKVRHKRPLLEGRIDVAAALKAQTLYEFDDKATAPLYGYAGAEDYYTQCSSKNFLPHITLPTLLLRALDDPFMAARGVPEALIRQNRVLSAGITAQGGHVGFAEGGWPWLSHFWAERQAARFLAVHLL